MKYTIKTSNQTIAVFENKCDRDDCLDFLEERYDDCEFEAEEAEYKEKNR